jgi:hypothetical protein
LVIYQELLHDARSTKCKIHVRVGQDRETFTIIYSNYFTDPKQLPDVIVWLRISFMNLIRL